MIQVKNAVICDGTGKEPFSGELLIDGEKLAEVSPIPFGELDAEVLDARGMAVTPGFIDAHRHCDLAALYDPEFGRLELAQGITTAVMGNCGLAMAGNTTGVPPAMATPIFTASTILSRFMWPGTISL